MRLMLIGWSVLLYSLIAYSQPTSKIEYCSKSKYPNYFIGMFYSKENRLAFSNSGGLFNQGVCWWHSLFQRSATYLAIYLPYNLKPTEDHVKKIIHNIFIKKEVTYIPGYRNLYEFSQEWEELIQRELERAQITDGFVYQRWIQGLSGERVVSSDVLANLMDSYYRMMRENRHPVFQLLQLKGIASHAWLLLNMVKTKTGYDLHVIDSNKPLYTLTWKYAYGQMSLEGTDNNASLDYSDFISYTERESDMKKFKKAINSFCAEKNELSE